MMISNFSYLTPIGYMNNNGRLNLERFERFLQALAEREKDHFEDIYSDAKWIEGKTSKKVQGSKSKIVTDTPGPAHVEELLCSDAPISEGWEIVSHHQSSSSNVKKDEDLMRLLQSAEDYLLESSADDEQATEEQDSMSDADLSAFEDVRGQGGRDNTYHIGNVQL